MREIKELISLEDAKKLIGATVQGVFVNERGTVERPRSSRGIVTDVIVDYEGDLRFSLHGRGNAWLQGPDEFHPWYLEVIQDPPQATETPDEEPRAETLTERVERLKNELKTAEDALACEGLPDGWIRDDARDNRGGARSPRIALCDSLGNLSQAIQWNNDDHTEVYAERRFGGRRHQYVGISTDALFAWVDLVRAENPDT